MDIASLPKEPEELPPPPPPPPSSDWGITKTFDNTPVPQPSSPAGGPASQDASLGGPSPESPNPEPPIPDIPPAPEVTPPIDTPQPVSGPAPAEETFVVPPAAPLKNPFIGEDTTVAPGTTAPPPKRSGFKRILTFLFILIVLGALGAGAYMWYGQSTTAKEATIIYWGLWEDTNTIGRIIADFQTKNPNIKVQYVKQSARQYRERLQAAIARGEGPDVFEFHNTWVPMFRNDLLPAPADITTTAEFASTFYPVASADLVGGSSVYGMPMMIDGLGLFYNTDSFTAAGVNPPVTWPELVDLVPKLTVKTDSTIQKSAIALGTTGNIEHYSDIVALMMMQNGARLATPTGKEAEDTLLFYRKFANASDPSYTWNETMDNSVYAFATGRVAMILAPSWRVFEIKQINPSLNFKIAPVPQLPGNTVNWASYWVEGVSSKSKSPKAAWAFVKHLASKETVVALYSEAAKTRLFGQPYARVDLAASLQSDPYVSVFISQAPTAKSFPLASRTFDNGINDKLIKYLEDAINAVGSGTSPSQALATAAQGFAQILGSFGLTVPPAATTP